MKYYLGFNQKETTVAASKARNDAELIFEKQGYHKLAVPLSQFITSNILLYSTVQFILVFFKLIMLEKGAIIVLHYPSRMVVERMFHSTIFRFRRLKKFKVIYLIHDLYGLRDGQEEAARIDFNRLKRAGVIISHNERMSAYLVKGGISRSNIVNLQIFDYIDSKASNTGQFGNSVIIAGGLMKSKLGPLEELGKCKEVQFNLYGPQLEEDSKSYSNIHYFGSFPPSEIISKVQGSYGLVFDAPSESLVNFVVEYQKYNNPHKVSLYLAGGFPVIIWKEAALSSFIEINEVGFSISNLQELSESLQEMTKEEYKKILDNVQVVGKKIREGYYLSSALEKSENIVQS